MSVNDKEIDVLLRRFANSARTSHGGTDHLDADELNAFAEGAMPAAARQRYVSHLADCDDCRKLAAQLAIASGGAVETVPAAQPIRQSWRMKLGALFAPSALRYAAFAVLLIAVVGISFLVWRRPAQRNAESVAQNQPQTTAAEATNAAPAPAAEQQQAGKPEDLIAKNIPQPTVAPNLNEIKERTATTAAAPPPPKPDSPVDVTAPAIAGSREAPRQEASPSYAPAPTTGTYQADDRAREQRRVGEPVPSGPRRGDSDKYKSLDRNVSSDLAKGRDEERTRNENQPAAKENKSIAGLRDTSAAGVVNMQGRATTETKVATRKAEATEETPETRSVGGRKFKRQGNAWIDSKLKSSMSIRNVTRGSEEFEKLDPGLRSIAQQLNGEIVVVWKGKAYRIN